MAAHPLILLDTPTQIGTSLLQFFTNLFTLPVAITALILALVLALLALGISYLFLRPKETCSMVCSIHFLAVLGALLAGLLGGFGIVDATLKDNGSLITGAGVALVVLAIPIWLMVKSFDWVVLSNNHARRHRDLRTPQDKRVRNWTVFLVPLVLGGLLIAVGAALSSQKLTPVQEVVTLLVILWGLALVYVLISWLRARGRRRRLAALGTGAALDKQAAAQLWTSGFNSYRIGRGQTEVVHWETFSERVVITEELLLEEEHELDLVSVEVQETRASGLILAGAGAAGSAAVADNMRVGAAPHINDHRNQRQPGGFRQRWSLVIVFLVIAVIAIIIAALAGVLFTSLLGLGIILAFLAPVIFLILHRFLRDNERKFATEMVDKISTAQPVPVAVAARPAYGTAAAQAPGGAGLAAGGLAAGAAGLAAGGLAAEATAPTAPAPTPPTALRPNRPTPVVPPAAPPVIPPKEPAEPPTMPSVDTAAAASAAALAAGQAHANPDVADETLVMRPGAIPATPGGAADDEDSAELGQALQGASFPANRAHLLERARANGAPRHLIGWLEGLGGGITFASLAVLIERYRKHRAAAKAEDQEKTITRAPGQSGAAGAAATPVTPAETPTADEATSEAQQSIQGASFPATAGSLLERARANNGSRRFIGWLEGLGAGVSFASLVILIERYRQHRAAARAEDEEKTITRAPSGAAAPAAGQAVSSTISITEFQRYLRRTDYPADRAELLENARNNGATANMIARLEELDPTYEFGGVREVMRGYVFYHYLRDASYPATRDQLLAQARSRKASRSLILWLESVSVSTSFASSAEAMHSFARYRVDEEEVEEEVTETAPSAAAMAEAEDETITLPPAGQRITTSIKITDFQRYLHGMRYPAKRAELVASARGNNAPPNMLARLGELDETYTFHGVTEVMRGYIFYHYLRDAGYPATREHLLGEARAKKSTRSLLIWLESLSVTIIFATSTEAMQSYARYRVAEAEIEEEVEEVEAAEATTSASQRSRRTSRRRVTTTQLEGYLRGVQYPARRRQLLASARANHAQRVVIIWLETVEETVVFNNFTEVSRSFTEYQSTHEEEVEDEEATVPTTTQAPAAPAAQEEDDDEEDDEEGQSNGTRVRRIRVTEFQRYLKGTDYPADRAELLENARKNGASETMIAILEELDATYEFTGVRDVMRGYSYHRYLHGISYPTTRAQLLERARANKASSSLTRWLEGLSETASFTSMGDVLKNAPKHS